MKDDRQSGTASALRRAFDEGFARAPAPPPDPGQAFLAVTVAGQRYAFALGEIGEVLAGRTIAPLPSPEPALLGLLGLRGELLPVYDVALLLGHRRALSPRWVAVARVPEPVGFAFEELEAYLTAKHELDLDRPLLRAARLLAKRSHAR